MYICLCIYKVRYAANINTTSSKVSFASLPWIAPPTEDDSDDNDDDDDNENGGASAEVTPDKAGTA